MSPPDETPQPVETTATSSSKNSTPDPRVLDALNRLAKAEAWLEDHDDDHPQWEAALARLRTIIGELTELELQGAAIDW